MLTDDEIFAQLAELENQSKKELKFYVYFNPLSGDVVHLRNYLHEGETDHPHIEIAESKLRDLDPDKGINIDSLQVVRQDGKFTVTRKHELVDSTITADSLIYRIPKIKNSSSGHDYDLKIEQDRINKIFRFSLSDAMKSQYATTVRDERAVGLYLTNERDPNILRRTFQLNLYYLSNSDYTVPFDGLEGDVNDIFCLRYFQKYLHVIIG